MNVLVFILLMVICIGNIYLVHKYFNKSEFYLLGIIYTVISFIMSFKLIKIFGIDINMSIIFSSSLVMLIYYFGNRYGRDDSRKLIYVISITLLSCIVFLIINSFTISSLYDTMSSLYQTMVLENIPILILYPVSLIGTLFLSDYCFAELSGVKEKKMVKGILSIIGISFIDVFIFIYFSYAFIIRFDIAMNIAINSLFIKVIIMIIYFLVVTKIFKVRKVK